MVEKYFETGQEIEAEVDWHYYRICERNCHENVYWILKCLVVLNYFFTIQATGWVQWIYLRVGRSVVQTQLLAIFSVPIETCPEAHPSSCTMGTGDKLTGTGRGIDHPPPSSAKIKEREELYVSPPSSLSPSPTCSLRYKLPSRMRLGAANPIHRLLRRNLESWSEVQGYSKWLSGF